MIEKLRIGSRASPLALSQAKLVGAAITRIYPQIQLEYISLRTSGDIFNTQRLTTLGGKGLFTKELEEALLASRIDIAVHSLKDMATRLPEQLVIAAVLPREDPRDAFLSNQGTTFKGLPRYSIVGTSSLRREAFSRYWRPDLRVVPLRGNVESRLRKIAGGEADGTFLAVSGLKRVDLSHCINEILDPEEMLPAVAQGCVAIQSHERNEELNQVLESMNDLPTMYAVKCERAFLRELDGSCRTPIAALAEVSGGDLFFRGAVIRPDGGELILEKIKGSADDHLSLGVELAQRIKKNHGDRLQKEFRI